MMALQRLCIRVIVDEFERYLDLSKSDVHKRKLHFLQRVYSDTIARLLYEKEKSSMPRHYVDFLVNKYTTYLDMDYFKQCSLETVTTKLAEMGSKLKEIHFQECRKEIPWQDVICHLYNVEKVSFPRGCNDEILKYIAEFCPNIVEIDVRNSPDVTDKGMKYLCMEENGVISCPKLGKLWIEYSGVTLECVVLLVKNLRSLESIDHDNLPDALYSLHKNDLSELHKIQPYKFTSLSFIDHVRIGSHYNDLLHICLTLCPRLKNLHCSILKETFDFFPCLNELEKLELDCSNHRGFDLNNLLKFKTRKLIYLTVYYGSLSVSNLSQSCPNLTNLLLFEVILQNNSDILPIFEHLAVCQLASLNSAAAQSISLLLTCSPALKSLHIEYCDLSSSEVKPGLCCKESGMEIINFLCCVVEINLLKDMLRNWHPARFYLSECNLDSEEEIEIHRFAQQLPNVPQIVFN